MADNPKRMLERIFDGSNANPKNLDFILEAYAGRFMRNGVEISSGAWKRAAEGFYSAFPNAEHELLDVTVEGDRIFNRYTMRGTHTGDLVLADRIVRATGRRFDLWGIELRRCRDGRFVELWSSETLPQFLAQMEAP